MQSAPTMANGISIDCGNIVHCENIILVNARSRPTAIPAPTMAFRGALNGIGKARARYRSMSPVTADTRKVKRNAAATA